MVQVRGAGGRVTLPAECFGIKYRFNYLRERFMPLRKVRREKSGDVCTKSVFLRELIMGMSVEELFESVFYGNLF